MTFSKSYVATFSYDMLFSKRDDVFSKFQFLISKLKKKKKKSLLVVFLTSLDAFNEFLFVLNSYEVLENPEI